MFVSTASAEGVRAANSIVHRSPNAPSGATAASVFALWILIPLALGALAYILIGLVLLLGSYEPGRSVDPRLWVFSTLVLQTAYWSFLADRKGLGALRGLWALIPVVALIPTFGIARAAARPDR